MKFYLVIFLISSFCAFVFSNCENDRETLGPDGNCYYYGLILNWYQTYAYCNLPIVTSAIINNFVWKLAQNYSVTEPFWLGAAVDYKSEWSWVDGVTKLEYTNWAQGEPKSSERGTCMLMDPFTGKWITGNCSAPHPSICEVLQNSNSTLCPPELQYSIIMNKCIGFIGGNFESWGVWDYTCLNFIHLVDDKRGRSVSIHNDFDNLVVHGVTFQNEPVYVGIHDEFQNGTFGWYDGSKVDYTNWASQPPDGSCALMYPNSTLWYPIACDAKLEHKGSAVCELVNA